jgi:probable phosphoglycerate mutase
MTEFILLRHGETDWNRELRFQGQVDVPLNATGHAQALRLAQRLAGEPIAHLISSDLTRARQTADPLAQGGMGMAFDTTLREQAFGRIDGMRVEDIRRDHADIWAGWVQFQADYVVPGGESTRQFHDRVMSALWQLAASHPGQTLAVVTHGGVLDMVFRTARGLGLEGPRQSAIPNAGLNRVRLHGGVVELLQWADTAHLEGMPAQPVYEQQRPVRD